MRKITFSLTVEEEDGQRWFEVYHCFKKIGECWWDPFFRWWLPDANIHAWINSDHAHAYTSEKEARKGIQRLQMAKDLRGERSRWQSNACDARRAETTATGPSTGSTTTGTPGC